MNDLIKYSTNYHKRRWVLSFLPRGVGEKGCGIKGAASLRGAQRGYGTAKGEEGEHPRHAHLHPPAPALLNLLRVALGATCLFLALALLFLIGLFQHERRVLLYLVTVRHVLLVLLFGFVVSAVGQTASLTRVR